MKTRIGARLDSYSVPRSPHCSVCGLDFYTVKGSAWSAPLETSRPSNDQADGGRELDPGRRSARPPDNVRSRAIRPHPTTTRGPAALFEAGSVSVDIKDILLKAAEDVTQGMWCKGNYFEADEFDDAISDVAVLRGWVSVDDAAQLRRCAHGSLALATALLGGEDEDYWNAVGAVFEHIPVQGSLRVSLVEFNDEVLPDDPFQAGQQLAGLFRTTAESL